MKAEYEISIINSSTFKSEAIGQVIENLDKLENISNDVFYNISESLKERKKRAELLSARISRISQIIKILENVPEAITLLSKKFYPENLETYQHKSIYYNDICDFSLLNQVNKYKEKKKLINSKPANSLEDLGKTPDTTIDDIKLCQEIINSVQGVTNIKTNLTLNNSYNPIEEQPIAKEIEMLSSVYGFTTKIKAFGNQMINNINNLNRDSNLLNQFMKQTKSSFTKKQKQLIKKPSQAPTSLMSNNTKSKVDPKKDVLRVKTKVTNDSIIDSKIKQNINMPNVVNIDIGGSNIGFGEFNNFGVEDENLEDSTQIISEGQVVPDDINDFELPIDKVYKLNINRLPKANNDSNNNLEKSNTNPNTNYNNNPSQQNNNNQTNQLESKSTVNNSNTTEVQQKTNNTQVVNSNISSQVNLNNQQKPITNNDSIPKIPTIPNIKTVKVPNIPGVPQVKIVSNGGSNVPIVPKINIPIPKIKPKAEIEAKVKVEENKEDKEVKVNEEIKDSEEKKEEEKAPPKKDPVSFLIYINFILKI
jgi:hypothetical protein